MNEVRILASVKSNFVISYKEAFFDDKDSTLGIVMEYADSGDLYQKIVEHKKAAMFFDESDIWRIFIQLVKGLKALHDLKILHRDLKSANVFLESDGSAKLGDLNVSKVARKGLGYTQTGTPYYASPEVWKDQPYNYKSDIWSLGCVLYEMITLKPPFRAENMEGLYNKVIKGVFARIPERFSPDLMTVVKLLLQVNPNDRPSCEQILKNHIIQKRIDYFASFTNTNDENLTDDQALLQTIRIPKNLLFLSDKLPRPNYDKHQHMKNYRSFSNNSNTIETEKKLIKSNTVSGDCVAAKMSIISDREHKVHNSNNNGNGSGSKLNVIPHPKRKQDEVKRKNASLENKYKNDLPQLNIISTNNKKNEEDNTPTLAVNYRNVKIQNYNKNSHNVDNLYKIYAPYLVNPLVKQNEPKKVSKLKVMYSPNANYLNNLERYYSIIRARKEHKSNNESMDRRVYVPKRRKLSPLKRKIVNVNI